MPKQTFYAILIAQFGGAIWGILLGRGSDWAWLVGLAVYAAAIGLAGLAKGGA